MKDLMRCASETIAQTRSWKYALRQTWVLVKSTPNAGAELVRCLRGGTHAVLVLRNINWGAVNSGSVRTDLGHYYQMAYCSVPNNQEN